MNWWLKTCKFGITIEDAGKYNPNFHSRKTGKVEIIFFTRISTLPRLKVLKIEIIIRSLVHYNFGPVEIFLPKILQY